MKKIGVFGGTFNPIHKGHEKTAKEFYDKFNLCKLLIIPAFIAPHKEIDRGILPYQRFEMCKLAFGAEEYKKYNIEVSDIEIKKEGKSYSFNTVTALYDIYPKEENIIYFLVGTDMFFSVENWYRYEELLKLCVFTAAYRFDGDDKDTKNKIFKKRNDLIERGYKVELLENSIFEVSSTELRNKIKKVKTGQPRDLILRQYLNQDVIEYINRENLYI